jgi:hypothetical protein
MKTTTTDRIYYDSDRRCWALEVGGPGRPVARSDSRDVLEAFGKYVSERKGLSDSLSADEGAAGQAVS